MKQKNELKDLLKILKIGSPKNNLTYTLTN